MSKWMNKNDMPPIDRPLICYCPEWCEEGYQIGVYNGKVFTYNAKPNEMFDSLVEQWALFMEAD